MVPRTPKLIAAAAVLALGFALAWPWRRDAELPTPARIINPPAGSLAAHAPAVRPPLPDAIAAERVPASTLASEGGRKSGEFISAARPTAPQSDIGPTPPGPFGAPPPVSEASPLAPQMRSHIVHEGDTLERIADRYLGDAGRAIEIFDLNRDILENPHLLRIGAELKIPQESAAADTVSSSAVP